MLINKEMIKPLNPCQDRFNNFVVNYPEFNGELKEFLSLDKITYKDKIWVGVRLMTRTQKVKFSIKCAESVLHLFESKYPNDKRPRECIEHLKTYKSFENLTQEQKDQIWKVRKAVAAYAAAYAAADAAAYAAAAATYAADAAYAYAADAAYAYADADAYAYADTYAYAYAAADADAAAYAASATTYAYAYAASATTYAAADAYAAAARKSQEDKNLQFILETLETICA
jgi:hypothetical protein